MTSGLSAGEFLPISVEQFLSERRSNSMTQPNGLSKFMPPEIESGEETVDAFIAIENASAIDRLTSMGVNIQSIFDGFVTARVPVRLLEQVSMLAGVTDIDISRRVELCTDSTLSVTHAGQLHEGVKYGLPQSYDGSGVIVGVIDVGFDYQHRAYRKANNPDVTRIVRIYDTRNTSGHPVYNKQGTKLPGSVFMNDEIYSLTSDGSGTHGTHTSSIAAGTNLNGYGGMAPGADIVLCAVKVLDGSLSTVEIANCIKYITCYADSVGKPCVMSLSVSTATGQHDGLDYLSRAVSQCVGKGKIFVISAGNCGDRPMYVHKQVNKTQPLHLLFKYKKMDGVDSSYYYSQVNTDIWIRGGKMRPAYRWHILDLETGHIVWQGDSLTGSTVISSSQFSDYFDADPSVSTESMIQVIAGTSSNGRKYNIDISMSNLLCQEYTVVNGVKKGRYAIGLSIYPRDNVDSDIDVWLGHSASRCATYDQPVITMTGNVISDFYTGSNNDCTIGTYAVSDSVISVGAFAARNSYYSLPLNRTIVDKTVTVGEIADFSSFQIEGAGPTGAALPTICAPGMYVVAAISQYSYLANYTTTVMQTEDGSTWGAMSGTSMSAPTVAGIIALWLQANPDLSVSQIKEILAQTAIRDDFTTGPNSAMFGPNGKIDAMAGIKRILYNMNLKLGDVNSNGFVNMDDLTLMINYLLGSYPPDVTFSEANADMNQNGSINMDDLTELINYLLTN